TCALPIFLGARLLHGGGHGSKAAVEGGPAPLGGHAPVPAGYCWRAASSTTRATGAATSPPTPPRTTSTATATFGAPTGANAMNQASVGTSGPPISEVPVFPATVTPGMAALRPVPSVTTASIIVVTSPAIRREQARVGVCGSR